MSDDDLRLLGNLFRVGTITSNQIFSIITTMPLVASTGMVAPYAITFYLFWKKYFRKKGLDQIGPKELGEQQVKLTIELDGMMQDKRRLDEKIGLLQKEKETAFDKRPTDLELSKAIEEMNMVNSNVDVTLSRIEFVNHVELLLKRRKVLEERGLWDSLKQLSKKNLKEIDKHISDAYIRHTELRNYLSQLNSKEDFYNLMARKTSEEKITPTALGEIEGLLNKGSPQQWLELLGKTADGQIELPKEDIYGKSGYRNLLIAILDPTLSAEETSKLFLRSSANKFTLRAIDFLGGLNEAGQKSYDPTSSERTDVDQLIQILSKQEVRPGKQEYEFVNSKGEKVAITRQVQLDEQRRARLLTYGLKRIQ